MKQLLTLSTIFGLLSGCETVVDIEVPLESRLVVVNSHLSNDSVISVHLSLSNHILNSEPYPLVKNATVVIRDDQDQLIETLPFGPSSELYKGSSKAVPGRQYFLTVDVPGYDQVTSTGTVPQPVPITKVSIDSMATDSNGRIPIEIFFKDPAGQKNYYELTVRSTSFWVDPNTNDTIEYDYPIQFEANDPLVESQNTPGSSLFEDVFFDGQDHKITVRVFGYYDPNTSAYVILRTMSEDYYKYLKSTALQNDVAGNPLAQPVLVFSNINNGIGIFGVSSTSVFEVK